MYESSQNGGKSATATNGSQASAAFRGVPEDERAFTLSDLARVALRRLWIILLVVSVVVGVALGASLWQEPTYEASAKVIVGQEPGAGQDDNLAGSVEGLKALTQSMIIFINTRPVAEEAIRRLELETSPDELLDNLTVEQIETSQFIQLSYTDTDPERATQIVNTVGQVSSERISATSAVASNIEAIVIERAIVPVTPVSPDPLRNGVLAIVLGLMLGIGLALLMEHLDHSWRSPEEAEQTLGVPTFATIPDFSLAMRKKPPRGPRSRPSSVRRRHDDATRDLVTRDLVTRDLVTRDLVAVHDPSGAASEAYKMLRTNLFYALIDSPPKIIVLTSANRGEGKSTTTANLGVTLAQADKNVLILDCDLRRPRLHSMFGVDNTRGLVDILAGGDRIEEVWREPIPGLKLICAGHPPPNPAELLSSRRLAEFLAEMRQRFDYVLVDTPQVGVPDSAVLAAHGDGGLLVLDSQRTRKGPLRRAMRALRGVGANVLGTVMNNVDVSRGENTPYGHLH